MSFRQHTDALTDEFAQRRPLRAGSLIITVYGDAVAPRGGTVWLGSLIRLLERFGLNARLVRTAVSRLAKDEWLTSIQLGRRSYYRLTSTGRRRFENATRRIYGQPRQAWDGSWCLVILPAGQGWAREQRDQLRRELGWQGFGAWAPGVLAHPAPDADALTATLTDLHLHDDVVVLNGETVGTPAPLKRLVQDGWQLDELETRYQAFVARFAPLLESVREVKNPEPDACLRVRTLLIHEYRKVLLRDPQLPLDLLPGNWAGTAAYQLCRELYVRTFAAAEVCLSDVLETADGSLPEPAAYFYERFGGLADS